MGKISKKSKLPNELRKRVPASTLNKWKLKREHGSIEGIHAKKKISKGTIANAFQGFATPSTVKLINEYFETAA